MTNGVGYDPEKITFSSLKPLEIEALDQPQTGGGATTAPKNDPLPATPIKKPSSVRANARRIAGANEDRLRQHFAARFKKEPTRDENGFIQRDPNEWRASIEPRREGAEKEIAGVTKGRSNAPVHAGHWSSFQHAGNPVFFQNIPSDENPTAQVYSYWDPSEKAWNTYEVAGDIYRAYADPKLTGGRLGTGSWLGYPTSNALRLEPMSIAPFQDDAEVKKAAASGKVTFQEFEGGYLVDLGNGVVRAFDQNGKPRTGG